MVIVSMVCLSSGSGLQRMRSLHEGHSSGGQPSQVGPSHQSVKLHKTSGDMPLDATSAGLSSVLTCLQSRAGTLSKIWMTLFITEVFRRDGEELSQLSTMDESVQA